MIITTDGSQLRCSETEHPDIYAAARIGLGALGVINEVTLCSACRRSGSTQSRAPADWMKSSTVWTP
jgi:hypothetical protein